MSDILQRFLFEDAGVRGSLVHLDASWQAVLERHDYPEPVREVLGEAMAASVLLAATLKFRGRITLQVQGSGPLSLLVVECTADRAIRGLAHWNGDVPEGDLQAKFGDGRLVITIDPGEGMERYQGIVALTGARLSAAIDEYLERSEQLATRLWLAADGDQASGMLLQKLPSRAEDVDAWQRVTLLGGTVTRAELLALEPRELIHRLFHEEDVRAFDSETVFFRCSCSRDRVANMLRSLGATEVESIIAEQSVVTVNCDFCNQKYLFDAVDAAQLFASAPAATSAPVRH